MLFKIKRQLKILNLKTLNLKTSEIKFIFEMIKVP